MGQLESKYDRKELKGSLLNVLCNWWKIRIKLDTTT
jgi:hypothetical protein